MKFLSRALNLAQHAVVLMGVFLLVGLVSQGLVLLLVPFGGPDARGFFLSFLLVIFRVSLLPLFLISTGLSWPTFILLEYVYSCSVVASFVYLLFFLKRVFRLFR